MANLWEFSSDAIKPGIIKDEVAMCENDKIGRLHCKWYSSILITTAMLSHKVVFSTCVIDLEIKYYNL